MVHSPTSTNGIPLPSIRDSQASKVVPDSKETEAHVTKLLGGKVSTSTADVVTTTTAAIVTTSVSITSPLYLATDDSQGELQDRIIVPPIVALTKAGRCLASQKETADRNGGNAHTCIARNDEYDDTSYKKANLEPPDYGRSEKYEPKPVVARAVKLPLTPKPRWPWGRRRLLPPANPPVANVSAPTPIDTSSGGATAPDLQVTHGQSRRGKEKRQDLEIEEVLTLKRTKCSSSSRPSELQEGLRERDSLAATLIDQIRDKVPGMQTIMGWSCNRLGEQIAKDILRVTDPHHNRPFLSGSGPGGYPRKGGRASPKTDLLGRAESRAKKDLADAEGQAEKAEKAEQEVIEKMKDASSFARFICSDEAIAKEFLTAFVNTEVGGKLVWIYGQWAFTSSCRAMQEQVHTTLTEGLEETELPGEVADPGPKPYSEPGPSK
nr:uncharacterized protein LOC109184184 [Ipomoea trifida]